MMQTQPTPVNIKVLVAAGARIRDAIRSALTRSLTEFARAHGLRKEHVSACINGGERHEKIRAALATELGVERAWLDELLDAERERRAALRRAA